MLLNDSFQHVRRARVVPDSVRMDDRDWVVGADPETIHLASINQRVTVSVVDKEGNLLGGFQMTGAAVNTRIFGRLGHGLEGE